MFSDEQYKTLEKIVNPILKIDDIDILNSVVTVINQRKQRIKEMSQKKQNG